MDRRNFLQQVTAATIATAVSKDVFSNPKIEPRKDDMIWSILIHLSYNMWVDYTPEQYKHAYDETKIKTCRDAMLWAMQYHPFLTCDKKVWDNVLTTAANSGLNTVIIDLGDGVRYQSHPELAVEGAWTVTQLKTELGKIRRMGLEPIPKLNFSTGHKAWLGPYQRMIGTKKYYEVCKNLINEVCDIFGKPRYFHIGMDEENPQNQTTHQYMVVRQKDLWWHDFYYLVDLVEKRNARSWIWSDLAWDHPDEFLKKMPKSVLQSNWYYYSKSLERSELEKLNEPARTLYIKYVNLYGKLQEHGFDQVPTGSNHSTNGNMAGTVDYCKKIIDPKHLKGFMQSVWRPTLPVCEQTHLNAVQQLKDGMDLFYK